MKKMKWICFLICLVTAVLTAAAGCLSSDTGNDTTTNNTSNLAGILETFGTPANPIDNTSYLAKNASGFLAKQVRVADDKKSIIFVFDESQTGDKWEFTMEPENVLRKTTDEFVKPEDGPETYPGIHVWIFEAAESGEAIMNYKYIVAETGKSINNVFYLVEVDDSGEIHITSVMHERL